MAKPEKPNKNTSFVDNYLLYLLAAASESASAEFHKKVRKAGLRVPEWRILAGLYDQNGMMVTELAKIALAEQSRLTHIIDQMQSRGLVRRGSDPKDRRKVLIYLTDEGQKIANSLVKQALEHEKTLLKALQDGDSGRIKPALHDLLEKLNPPAA